MSRLVITPHRLNVLLVLAGCIVLPPLTAEAMPRLLPGSSALTLCIGVSLAMAALSLNILVGYAGQLSLGHAALLGVGAFAASAFVDRAGLPMPVGFVASALAGGVVALIIGFPALRLRGLYLALVTMVFGLTMQASLLRWRFLSGGSAGASLPRRIFGDWIMTDASVYLSVCLVVLVGVWLVDRNIMRTKLGRAFQLIREDEVAAQAFGIDVTRYKLLAFVLSGAVAGLAGALYAHSIGLVNSDVFDLDLSTRIVLFVIIGGVGRRWGVALVAVLFSLGLKLPEAWQGYDLVVAAGIVLYNIVRLPGGLAGAVDHLLHGRGPVEAVDDDDEDDLPAMPDLVAVAPRQTVRSMGPVLEATDVSVRFGGLQAVDAMSATVNDGTIVGIIGPNGAGKSTFFNAVSGFVPGATGRVALDGQAIHQLAPHRRAERGLGRTFQLVGLARDLSVRENILLAQHRAATYNDAEALIFTRATHEVERALGELADGVIERLGFGDMAHQAVGSLSGGQQRLVELAAVLATGPRLLMLDEPTAGLSPAAAENLADRLHQLRADQGQAILLIEHNVPLVLDLCDYVYVMNAGRLLAEGTTDELGRRPEILGAYLGETVSA